MSAQGHTPEPWHCDDREFLWGADGALVANFNMARNTRPMSQEECAANAARTIACVNACAGLPDPERDVKDMRECLQAAWGELRRIHGDPMDCTDPRIRCATCITMERAREVLARTEARAPGAKP